MTATTKNKKLSWVQLAVTHSNAATRSMDIDNEKIVKQDITSQDNWGQWAIEHLTVTSGGIDNKQEVHLPSGTWEGQIRLCEHVFEVR